MYARFEASNSGELNRDYGTDIERAQEYLYPEKGL